jgi:cytochrome c553
MKPYAHAAVANGPSGHDAAEGPQHETLRIPESKSTAQRHVSCVDCHNPHGAGSQPAFGVRAAGALAGVWGIDRNGRRVEPVQYQYEVCFKCHGDSANKPQGQGPYPPETLRRTVPDHNLRRVFDLTSPSAHPIEGPGRNPDVPSLFPPLTAQSVITCTDCHASDTAPAATGAPPAAPGSPGASTATGARGPHGSVYLHLLERPLETADRTPESEAAYALCYKCHDRKVVLSDRSSFNLHTLHVAGRTPGDGAPCTACHASHGVSPVQGNPVNNAHLVDFDVSIVKKGKGGVMRYTSAGYRAGSCALSCHGVEHDDTFVYAPGKAAPAAASPALRSSILRR